LSRRSTGNGRVRLVPELMICQKASRSWAPGTSTDRPTIAMSVFRVFVMVVDLLS
jgi:hypothetical protein